MTAFIEDKLHHILCCIRNLFSSKSVILWRIRQSAKGVKQFNWLLYGGNIMNFHNSYNIPKSFQMLLLYRSEFDKILRRKNHIKGISGSHLFFSCIAKTLQLYLINCCYKPRYFNPCYSACCFFLYIFKHF